MSLVVVVVVLVVVVLLVGVLLLLLVVRLRLRLRLRLGRGCEGWRGRAWRQEARQPPRPLRQGGRTHAAAARLVSGGLAVRPGGPAHEAPAGEGPAVGQGGGDAAEQVSGQVLEGWLCLPSPTPLPTPLLTWPSPLHRPGQLLQG
jgi:hypothetical protein